MIDTFRRSGSGVMVRILKKPDLTVFLIAGKRNIEDVLFNLAARGAQRARELSPRITGRMAGSMRHHYGSGEKKYTYRFLVTGGTAVGILKGLGKYTAVFGTDVEYAPYVEWGTKRGMSGIGMLRGAADDVRKRIRQSFNNIMTAKKKRIPVAK